MREKANGNQASDLHGQSRDDAGRSARRRGDAAVFHREIRQRRQPQPRFGWEAEEAVEKARKQIADLIGATPKEIVFTSGATESNNLAIKGVAEMYREKGNHIITQVTEHKAVLDTCKRLEKDGYEVTYLPVQKDGLINLDDLRARHHAKTILISIMYANNEIGVIQPIAEIGKIAKEKGVLFHTDAVQAVGKIPFNVQQDGIDLLSISAHKMYGPKGVGALYVRRRNPRVLLAAMIDGGGHERGMRSGTLNVPGIVGLGKACELCQQEMAAESRSAQRACATSLNDSPSCRSLDEIYINGSMEHRLPHNLNISFAYVEGESLLMGINDVAVSSGSACTSASLEPSYVLKALGAGDDLAHSSIRFGLGRFKTEEEVDYVADTRRRSRDAAARAVAALRNGERRRRSVHDAVAGSIGFALGRAGSLDLRRDRHIRFGSEYSKEQRHMAYSDKVIDHYNNPRNVGSLDKNDPNVGTGLVGAPECGDVMKLQVKVNPETGVIDDAKFKTFGCGSAIASSRLATEWLKGKTVDEALAIKNTDIVNELSLPPVKIHCSVLAEDAIKAAIADYKKKQGEAEAKPAESATSAH